MVNNSLLCFLSSILFTIITVLSADGQDIKHSDRPALNALIDALANHNTKPVLVHVSAGHHTGDNPLFGEDYDWKEDERVRKAAKEVLRHNGEDLWWCLIVNAHEKLTHLETSGIDPSCVDVGQSMTIVWSKRFLLSDCRLPEVTQLDVFP